MAEKSEAEKLADIRSAVEQMSFTYKGQQRLTEAAPARSTPKLELEAEGLRRAEAVLFAAGEPLSAEEVSSSMPSGVDAAEILMTLQEAYARRGVNLVEAGGKWRFQTATDLSFLFTEIRDEDRKLSSAALETLAIIAYCQPVTRSEIEDVRGVAVSKGTLDILLECGWVRLRGRRKTPGRPVTYGTTNAFLEHFGLENLDTLPGKTDFQAAGLLNSALPVGFEMPRPTDPDSDETESLSDHSDDDDGSFHTDFLEEDDKLEH